MHQPCAASPCGLLPPRLKRLRKPTNLNTGLFTWIFPKSPYTSIDKLSNVHSNHLYERRRFILVCGPSKEYVGSPSASFWEFSTMIGLVLKVGHQHQNDSGWLGVLSGLGSDLVLISFWTSLFFRFNWSAICLFLVCLFGFYYIILDLLVVC